MTAATAHPRFFEHLVGDRLIISRSFSLDRFCGQFVAEVTFGPTFVKLCVREMAEVTGGLSDLEVLRRRLVLVACRAVGLHARNLFLLQ